MIQYIFQNPYGSLNPRRTIGQIVRQPVDLFGTGSGREADKLVGEMLERVSLTAAYAERYPDQLSGGERQRVAIARALVCEPAVLVCDEVTSALDVSVQAAIVELLAELQRDLGLSMLFVTHNLPLVRSIAQRVAVMNEGRIVELGAVDSVLFEPHRRLHQGAAGGHPVARGRHDMSRPRSPETAVEGTVAPGFEPLRNAFAEVVASQSPDRRCLRGHARRPHGGRPVGWRRRRPRPAMAARTRCACCSRAQRARWRRRCFGLPTGARSPRPTASPIIGPSSPRAARARSRSRSWARTRPGCPFIERRLDAVALADRPLLADELAAQAPVVDGGPALLPRDHLRLAVRRARCGAWHGARCRARGRGAGRPARARPAHRPTAATRRGRTAGAAAPQRRATS